MVIRYVGHSCFLLTTRAGVRILTDPYEHGAYDGTVRYRPVTEAADVVLVSHDHPDHSHVKGLPGRPAVVREAGPRRFGEVSVVGVPTFHDGSRGGERGGNLAFRIEADGVAVAHLGDLGHVIDEATAARLRPVDVLLLPVGGRFTIGAAEAQSVVAGLAPRLVIPMHYKTPGVDFPIETAEPFLRGRRDVHRESGSDVTLETGAIPAGVLVLTPANLP